MNALVALKKANKYTDLTALGLSSVVVDDVNKSITFTLTADGSQHTVHFDQPTNGASIVSVDIDDDNYLICTLSDGTVTKSTNPIEIAGTSGEDNKIESISVNGTEVIPDVNKNVNIEIPTISQTEGNQLEQKEDGLFVKEMSTKISTEEGNAITEKDDGIYVPSVSETKISEEEGNAIVKKEDGLYVATPEEIKISEKEDNQLTKKTDGLYVAPTDLTDYSTTDEVETLIDEAHYTTSVVSAHYEITDSTTENALEVVADGTATDGQIDISSVTPLLDGVTVSEGDYVVWIEAVTTKNEIYARKNDVYNKPEIDAKIAEVVAGGEIDLTNIDAKTVNGYTVESNVPADAVFTDTLNSDVLVEGSTVTLENLQSNVPFSEITVRGKNVFDTASGTATRCTAEINNNIITLTPTVMDGTASAYYQVPVLLKKGQTVTISGSFENNSGNTIQLGVLKIPEATISFTKGEETTATSGNILLTYTPDNDYSDAVFSLYARVNNGVSAGSVVYTDVQIEYNSIATDYVTPITGKDIAIDINGTVHTVTPDRVPYTIPDVIYQQSGVNTVSVTGDGEPSLSIVGVREDKAIEKLWNREIPVYDDSEIIEDIKEIRNSIPSTVKVKTGDFVTNSNGDIEPVILFNIGNNITDAIYYDNYLFAVSGEQPILYIVDSSNALMQIQCQGGDNAGFKKVAVCKDVSGNYTVFLTSVNNVVFFGSVNMSSNTLFFMGSVNESLIAVQYGKNVLSLNQMGNININNCNGDVINFNQELGVISLESFTSISNVRLFGNTTVAVRGIDSMGIEVYHIYDMSTGERWFFQDVTDENTTFTIDNIIAVTLYKDNLIIYSDQGMFYTIPNGSFYNPLAIAEKDEVANIIKVRSYTMSFNPMNFTADYANMDVIGEHLVLMGQTETAIYSPNTTPKTVHCNEAYKAFDGGNGIYFITPRECAMAEYETEEVDITEAFMRM